MTPEQKEAFRREVVEEAAKVCDDLWAAKDAWVDARIGAYECAKRIRTLAASQPAPAAHPDDEAVDRFAAAMKAKLAKKRDEGRGGWDDKGDCSNAFLSRLLREHVDKGDPLDVGNLAMMLHQRGERIAPAACPDCVTLQEAGYPRMHEKCAPADTGQAVALTYTNWRGETSERTIVPLLIWYGSTDWHPDPQWLLKAIDTEKGAERDFALKDFGHPTPIDAERVREDELRRAAQECLDEVDKMLAIDPPPIKYRAPYGSLARLRAALRQKEGGG